MTQDTVKTRATADARAYMPQLDGVRALAVAAVLIHHFVDGKRLPPGLRVIPWGFLGVRLFFVLSGFLITGILVRSRASTTTPPRNSWPRVRQFYARRFLRIFPLYYAVILVTYLADVPPVREVVGWLLSYTYNVHLARQGWYDANVSHFWSLAVEEQFYLLWPWVVLFAPRRALVPAAAAMVALGPAYRLLALLHEYNEPATYCATLACADSLGMGALLAFAVERGRAAEIVPRRTARLVLGAGVGGAALLQVLDAARVAHASQLYVLFFDLAVALVFAWVVATASGHLGGRGAPFLAWGPLVYCGKRSYGIYVYHLLVLYALERAAVSLDLDYPHGGATSLILGTAATLGVAALSWRVLELPFNRLKRHFE